MKNTITLSDTVKKAITKNTYYSEEQFISDAKQYIEAIKEGRVICSIVSVSKSGMSRKMKFLAYQQTENTTKRTHGYYRQFNSMFEALGFKIKDYCLNIGGCGMDMVFHTNYTTMHALKRMNFITESECSSLAQETPTSC